MESDCYLFLQGTNEDQRVRVVKELSGIRYSMQVLKVSCSSSLRDLTIGFAHSPSPQFVPIDPFILELEIKK